MYGITFTSELLQIFGNPQQLAMILCVVLIGREHLDLNATDTSGKTALHWSALYNRKGTIEVCLSDTPLACLTMVIDICTYLSSFSPTSQ